MNWIENIISAIEYIEKHLKNDIKIEDVCNHVYTSSYYFQKGFNILTTYSISEYIRNRRLYEAAIDLVNSDELIIDIAYKYGYDTPESFTKAYTGFHGVTPSHTRKTKQHQVFLPLKIKIEISGGKQMDNLIIEKMTSFKIIGFEREMNYETSYLEIPKFWDEMAEKYLIPTWIKQNNNDEIARCIKNNKIGEFGLCIEDGNDSRFTYIVGGKYLGGDIPSGMRVFEIPELTWAKFNVIGPMPDAIQKVNTYIFREWLPNNYEYKIAKGYNIEWYSESGDIHDSDYQSGIWIPIIKK